MPRDGERPRKPKNRSNGEHSSSSNSERRHRDRQNGNSSRQESAAQDSTDNHTNGSQRASLTSDDSTSELSSLQRLCDSASTPQSWDTVRNWLRTHSAADARIAAEKRGDYDTVPLHLACRNDPPTDVIEMLLMASEDMVRAADSFGWLPLHYACANHGSEGVLTLLVAEYPESTTSVDKRKRTPLHFALGRTERPADRRIVMLLGGTGAALFPDENRMLPLHYACAYGATEEALAALIDDNVETINATDLRGRTPLHFALGNADRPASPAVVGLILSQIPNVVNSIDQEGNLPIHLLATRSLAIGEYATEQRYNCEKCLGLYLNANPDPSADLLMSLQSLPVWLRDLAVVNPVVQRILNYKIAKILPTVITIGDFVFYFMVVVFFQLSVISSIRHRVEGTEYTEVGYLIGLSIPSIWFILRELVQAVSFATIGSFSTWLWDASNWFDMFYFVLIIYWVAAINGDNLDLINFRVATAFTFVFYWMNILLFLKGLMVGFAVFVEGVVYVLKRLAAFFVALLIILIGFAQVFYTLFRMYGDCTSNDLNVYIGSPLDEDEVTVCDVMNEELCVSVEPEVCEPSNDNPWCNIWSSTYKTFSMLLGEVDDNDFKGNQWAVFFFCLYMFGVVIVLANVLIAIVTDSYGVIKNERAAVVFWGNRLDFVAETDVIGTIFSNRIRRFIGKDGDDHQSGGASLLGGIWTKFMYLYDDDDYSYSGASIESIIFNIFRLFIGCVVIPIWLLVGFASFGVLWPPQVREYLLTSSVSFEGEKKEEEIVRLERCETLRQEVRMFHMEVRKDLDLVNDDLAHLRVLVSDTRSGIGAELKNLKRLVMEVYENNMD